MSRDRLLERAKELRDSADEIRLFKDALSDREELEVTLADRQSGKRVFTPVRGHQCTHVQVRSGSFCLMRHGLMFPQTFDLDAWLDAVVDTQNDEESPCLICGQWLGRSDLRFCETTQTKLSELTDESYAFPQTNLWRATNALRV